jgi:hypothetical protein
MSPAAATCPDDGELTRFLDRTLASSRAKDLESHFDRCQVCRELVFMLAGLDPQKPGDQ